MIFEKWLKRQKKRNDAVGDLSRDFIGARLETMKKSFEKYDPCDDAITSFCEAVEEWKIYVCPILRKEE